MSGFDGSAGIFLTSDPTVGIRFQVWPDNISDYKNVKWSSIEVIGRSEPIRTYTSSSPQTFRFKLMFVASIDAADGGVASDVKRKVDFLKSLVYPSKTSSGYTVNPPTVWLIVGDLINSRCIASSVSAEWNGVWDVESDDIIGPGAVSEDMRVTLPLAAHVDISFEVVNVEPFDSERVRRSGDLGRLKTFGPY